MTYPTWLQTAYKSYTYLWVIPDRIFRQVQPRHGVFDDILFFFVPHMLNHFKQIHSTWKTQNDIFLHIFLAGLFVVPRVVAVHQLGVYKPSKQSYRFRVVWDTDKSSDKNTSGLKDFIVFLSSYIARHVYTLKQRHYFRVFLLYNSLSNLKHASAVYPYRFRITDRETCGSGYWNENSLW
jgi:hypothetical protein